MALSEVSQQYFQAWNDHAPAAIVNLFTESGTYTDPVVAAGLSGTDIAHYAQGLFTAFPDLTFEVVNSTPTGNGTVAAQWIMRGTNTGELNESPPTGRTLALPGADFITIEGDHIRSVQGYFDQKTFVEQLGLQVIVQPHELDGLTFGSSNRLASGKRTKPGAVSLTWIEVQSEEEVKEVEERALQVLEDMKKMPGFISYVGITVGQRLCTVTAWEDAEAPRQLQRGGAHKEAINRSFGPDFSTAFHTGVYVPHHANPLWVLCTACGKMANVEQGEGKCQCGQPLPEHPPYW